MTPRRVRLRGVGTAIAALLVVWCAGFLAPDLQVTLLYAAPGLLLAMALLAGRYPGERMLEQIARRRRRRREASARPRGQRLPRARARTVARGGLLLARALAGRAPPCSWRTTASR